MRSIRRRNCGFQRHFLRRARPALQRRPDAAGKTEGVDGTRRAERLEAMQLDAGPLEAALLQDVARHRVGDAGAGEQRLLIELLEEIVDRGARGLGAETLAPMLEAEPVAELGGVRPAPVQAHTADRHEIMFDQEHQLAPGGGDVAHEGDGVFLRIGMRETTGVFRDAPVIGVSIGAFYSSSNSVLFSNILINARLRT